MCARKGFDAVEPDNEQEPKQYCKTARAIDFSAIHKTYDLFAQPWHPCVR